MKKAIRILLSLLLACGVFLFVWSNSAKNIGIPKISEEKAVSCFTENKEKFEALRAYLSEQSGTVSLTEENYKTAVQDENIRSSAEFIFRHLKCDNITKDSDNNIHFKTFGNYYLSEIEYISTPNPDFLHFEFDAFHSIDGSWHFSAFNSSDNPVKTVSYLAKCTFLISAIAFPLFYFALGAFPVFRKVKTKKDK